MVSDPCILGQNRITITESKFDDCPGDSGKRRGWSPRITVVRSLPSGAGRFRGFNVLYQEPLKVNSTTALLSNDAS